jgi:hypothetical protein
MSLQINHDLFLVIYHVQDLLIIPSVGGVGLVEYVCAHLCFTNCFSEEDPDFIPEGVE